MERVFIVRDNKDRIMYVTDDENDAEEAREFLVSERHESDEYYTTMEVPFRGKHTLKSNGVSFLKEEDEVLVYFVRGDVFQWYRMMVRPDDVKRLLNDMSDFAYAIIADSDEEAFEQWTRLREANRAEGQTE